VMFEIILIVALLGLAGGAILVPAQTPPGAITFGVSGTAVLVSILTGVVVDRASLFFEALSLAKPSGGFSANHPGLAVGAAAGQLIRKAQQALFRR
jgi:hypothetical protein